MILCLGTTPTAQRTLTFDRLRLDEVNRAASVDDYASGKAVNVARVAAMLGADALIGGFVGGPRGKFLSQELSADGMRHDFVSVDAPTRLCTTLIDRHKETVTELVEESRPVTPRDWTRLIRRTASQLKSAAVCVMSGSLPPGGPIDFYRDVIARAVPLGVKMVLDARGAPLHSALTCSGFIVKLNRQELAATVGRSITTDTALKRAMQETCPAGGQLIVTLGAEGAAAWDGRAFWRVSAPGVQAVNTVGSGDAFAGGLAVALSQNLPPRQAYRLAAACGAANALHPRAGHVNVKDVERLRRRVKVAAWS